jgi:hypothetical protein
MRPLSHAEVSGVPSRSCTTKAQDGASGARAGRVGSVSGGRSGCGGLARRGMLGSLSRVYAG